ncbi:MAG: hypothetical protein ACKVVP_04315, partial [Chloroflexota bacterium]
RGGLVPRARGITGTVHSLELRASSGEGHKIAALPVMPLSRIDRRSGGMRPGGTEGCPMPLRR